MIENPAFWQLMAPTNSELLAKAILKYIENPDMRNPRQKTASWGLAPTSTCDDWPNQWLI